MRNHIENGIQQIRIRNFKVFRQPSTFNIRGRHVLVYGPNGSGKSSLYWALYTLLQAITKSPDETGTSKYFEFEGKESLLNINEEEGAPSYLMVRAMVEAMPHRAMLSAAGLQVDKTGMNRLPYPANWLAEANLAAEFINHRQLIGFYNFANSEPIDLLGAFEGNFYPFIQQEQHARAKTLADLLEEATGEVSKIRRITPERRARLTDGVIKKLNDEYGLLVNFLNEHVNTFLTENFKKNALKVKLKNEGAYNIVKQDARWVLGKPKLFLTIDQLKSDAANYHDIDRPQSFLNEALLTRIGVAIRFTLLQRRLQKGLRIMLMDDLLISMDMDNRSELFKTIERKYQSDYQLFIFTHDRGLYNELRRNIGEDTASWAVYEVHNGEFRNAKTELEKAKNFLEKGDFDACALELRKLAEIVTRHFLLERKVGGFNPNEYSTLGEKLALAYKHLAENATRQFNETILKMKLTPEEAALLKQNDIKGITTNPEIAPERKTKLIGYQRRVMELAEKANLANTRAVSMLQEVKSLKDRILNFGAHPSDEPLYRTEMEEAVAVFERFKDILFATS